MSIISLLVLILVLFLVGWLIFTYIVPKLPAPFGTIVIIICVIIACLILLGAVGIGPGIKL